MAENTKIPAIRFAGFSEAWEQRKLSELTENIDTGKSKFVSKDSGNYEILGSTSVIGFDDSYDYEGDFLLTARVGANAGNLYRHAGKVKISDNTVFIQGSHIDFLYYLLEKFDLKRLSFGTGQPLVKASELRVLSLTVPSDDQEKDVIGDYFKRLDNLITLHQREYGKFTNVKKSMLEKMFPKNGSNVPEIRFKGFTEAWEQRKVGDFLTESRIRGNTGLDAKKLTVKLWGKGVIEKNDFGGSEQTQYFTRRKGQFIYSKLDFLNSAFGVIPEKLDNYESTADLPTFDLDGMNPYFMFFTAIQEDFYLKYGSIADGSRKAKRIHADTFLNMPIMVPTIDEQKLIVGYLQCLDNLITLHQRKLEKLRNIKKSMLEKMFI